MRAAHHQLASVDADRVIIAAPIEPQLAAVAGHPRPTAQPKPGTTRTKAEAAQRASELLGKLRSDADFAALAREQSDAPSSAPRGGVMGTYRKADWPELHAALRDPVFALKVGEVAPAPI